MKYALVLFLLFLTEAISADPIISDNFDAPKLDSKKWAVTSDGLFRELVVNIFDADPSGLTDYRLRFRANTIGTSSPMKYLGVRTKIPIDFSEAKTISCDIDWNDQENGSYLSAAIYICPTPTNNPKKEPTWIAFEYTGVPPGRNLRTNVWARRNKSLKVLYEDWGPRDDRARPLGRAIGDKVHNITIILDATRIHVIEDGEELHSSDHFLDLERAYIYLQMSTGTNYPSREIYFDNFEVISGLEIE